MPDALTIREVLFLVLPLLTFAAAWGGTKAALSEQRRDIERIDRTVTDHVTNYAIHQKG